LVGLGVSLVWAYWGTVGRLAQTWTRDAQYSHGFLVPVFAGVLLWLRRDHLPTVSVCFSWQGLPLLALAAILRLGGTYYFFTWLDSISLLFCLAGLVVVVGDWAALRWAWPAIGFLAFMIPLPYQLQMALGGPLQRIAAVASAYALQTLGRPAVTEGNIIVIDETRVGVVEACNGLSMLVIFFAISTAVAGLVRRPWWEKTLIVASAVPVALLANIIRITATALLYELAGKELGDAIFHDWSGWLMMPLALGMLWVELCVLSYLFTEEEPAQPIAVC
jgi:exosortase